MTYQSFHQLNFGRALNITTGREAQYMFVESKNGYSEAWLHHKGRNKHHFEYWEDISKTERKGAFLPYKYLVEALCDKLAAGKAYNGKEWSNKEPIKYWMDIERKAPVAKHPGTIEFMDTVLQKIADDGIDAALNRKYLKKTYNNIYNKYLGNKQ